MTTTTLGTEDTIARLSQRLSQHVGPRKYAMWFDRSAALELDHEAARLKVAVPSRFVADWIERHFTDNLRSAVCEAMGEQGRTLRREEVGVEFEIDAQRFDRDEMRRSEAGSAPAAPEPAIRHAGETRPDPQTRRDAPSIPGLRPLRLRHSLDEFVTGPSNELAFSAADRLAGEEDPDHPLFLHGGCGLGKTHLLQGICQRLLEQRPDARVLYTTGEQFTNAYITAVRTNKLDAFRRSVRGLDLLAVDDVHFIANKQATQQEFLHSFEQIELTGSRLALASDQHPKAIQQFSEGLTSRCVRGLVLEIKPPDTETRRRLVRALTRRRGLLVTDVVNDSLAQKWTGSIRELEGLLAKLRAIASLHHGRLTAPIGRSIADKLFENDGPARPQAPARFENILDAVVQVTGVSREAILGRGRQRQIVLARSMLVHLTRELTTMSYPEVAAAMGKRNHSTAITADQRMHGQIHGKQTYSLPAIEQPITAAELRTRVLQHLGRA